MTVNDTIRDLQIRHAVNLQRLSTGTLRKLLPLLDKADEDIVNKLLKRGATLQGSYASKRLEALLDSIRVINRNATSLLAKGMKREMMDTAKYEAQFQKGLIEGALPFKFDVVTPSAEMLDAVVNARPFQGRLLREWVTELGEAKQRRLRDAVRMGVVQGETIDEIVRRVRGTRSLNYRDGVMAISRRGAEAMVRTAVAHTTTAARDALYDKNRDIIKSEQWVATLDTRTCPECMGLDGKTFDVGKGEKTPAHIGCRCVRVPVMKSWKELGFDIEELDPGTRASMNGQVSATETYGTWLNKQSSAVQDEALGPARGKLFREGMKVDSFTNRAGEELTLDELRAKEAA